MIWISLGILLFLVTLGASVYTYFICFHSPKKRCDDPFTPMQGEQYAAVAHLMFKSSRIMASTECESVTIHSADGLILSGRYYAVREGAPLILSFHGYRSTALRDCAGAFAMGLKFGFNVLAVDQRSHGKSQGNTITFGIKERLDCLQWVGYAVSRFGEKTPIILSGVSMGASTVLMSANLDLPGNVCCIMADCPYASPAGIIRKVAADKGYPEKLVYPFIALGARLFGRFRLTESDALTAVEKAKIPILLLHGEDDRFIPYAMSQRIYEHCASRAEIHTFPDAGHGLSYVIAPQRYEAVCVNFLQSIPALQPWMEAV